MKDVSQMHKPRAGPFGRFRNLALLQSFVLRCGTLFHQSILSTGPTGDLFVTDPAEIMDCPEMTDAIACLNWGASAALPLNHPLHHRILARHAGFRQKQRNLLGNRLPPILSLWGHENPSATRLQGFFFPPYLKNSTGWVCQGWPLLEQAGALCRYCKYARSRLFWGVGDHLYFFRFPYYSLGQWSAGIVAYLPVWKYGIYSIHWRIIIFLLKNRDSTPKTQRKN